MNILKQTHLLNHFKSRTNNRPRAGIWAFLLLLSCSFAVISCNETDDIPEFTSSNSGPYVYEISHLELIKDAIDSDPVLTEEYNRLITGSEQLLTEEFQYVTDKPTLPPSRNKNDYMSLARYLWPDANGDYTITRDGITNPEIYDYDRPKLARFSQAVHSLSLAYYFSGDERFAEKASELLENWFFEPDTRMNPNMNHAQVAKNVNEGSAQGIIDGNDFIQVIDAVSLIYDSPHWTPEYHRKLKEWFYHFSIWIIKNYNSNAFCDDDFCNNISTWMDAQKTIYFLFSEQEERINSSVYIQPVSEKIDKQFTTTGVQSFERDRARSQHYVYFNLRGYANLLMMRNSTTGFSHNQQPFSGEEIAGLEAALNALNGYVNGADVPDMFMESESFDHCRYIEIFKPAAIALGRAEYSQTAGMLIDRGCRNPDVTLTFPSLNRIQSAQIPN